MFYVSPRCCESDTNSIKHSPFSEYNSRTTSQEIPSLLWNPKFNYNLYKSSLLVPILSQINPDNTHIPFCFKITFNIIFPCMLMSPEYLPFRFPDKYFAWIYHLPCMLHVPSISSSSSEYHDKMWWRKAYQWWTKYEAHTKYCLIQLKLKYKYR